LILIKIKMNGKKKNSCIFMWIERKEEKNGYLLSSSSF